MRGYPKRGVNAWKPGVASPSTLFAAPAVATDLTTRRALMPRNRNARPCTGGEGLGAPRLGRESFGLGSREGDGAACHNVEGWGLVQKADGWDG